MLKLIGRFWTDTTINPIRGILSYPTITRASVWTVWPLLLDVQSGSSIKVLIVVMEKLAAVPVPPSNFHGHYERSHGTL